MKDRIQAVHATIEGLIASANADSGQVRWLGWEGCGEYCSGERGGCGMDAVT